MKTKWRPRLGSTFPRYILRSIYFLKKYSEINMLPPTPGLNFYPKMYSENKFTSPKMYSKRCKRAKAFSTLLQIFSSSAPETSDRSRGRGSSEKTENIEQFDVVHTILTVLTSARLRHSADFRRGRNPVSHLWSDYTLWAAGRTLFRRLFFNALHDCTIVQVGHNSGPLTGCP